jgi:hypothetical protein
MSLQEPSNSPLHVYATSSSLNSVVVTGWGSLELTSALVKSLLCAATGYQNQMIPWLPSIFLELSWRSNPVTFFKYSLLKFREVVKERFNLTFSAVPIVASVLFYHHHDAAAPMRVKEFEIFFKFLDYWEVLA